MQSATDSFSAAAELTITMGLGRSFNVVALLHHLDDLKTDDTASGEAHRGLLVRCIKFIMSPERLEI